MFGHSLRVAVPGPARLALFLTAWLIYLSDRFADAMSLSDHAPKSARETFCRKHRHIWLGLMLIVAILDGIVVFDWLDWETVRRGIFLALIAGGYLAINLRFGRLWRIFPVKEICVGFLFASGTLLALVPHLRIARSTINVAAGLFASLCALNCISIAAWERDLDLEQHKNSIATKCPRIQIWAESLLIVLACSSALLAFADPSLSVLAVCLGASSALLFVLHFLSITRDSQTALADLVLLTPFVLFAVEYLM